MNIFLTLDYELFMGEKTGTVQNCLITPMKRLSVVSKILDVRFTIFADAAYLYRCNELKHCDPRLMEDFEEASSNLRSLSEEGHDIQLHIHPQWYYSTYEDGQWVMDFKHYKLSDMEETDMIRLFTESKKLLEEIIGKEIKAFRAGGYSLQSLSKHCEVFRLIGIKLDSSVASGQVNKSLFQNYDYSHIRGGLYRFDNNVSAPTEKGDLLELAISNIRLSYLHYLLYRLYTKYIYNVGCIFGDGKPVPKVKDKIRLSLLDTITLNASMDYILAPLLIKSYKEAKRREESNFVVIGHPKNLSDKSIEELALFIKKVKKETSFRTVSEIL